MISNYIQPYLDFITVTDNNIQNIRTKHVANYPIINELIGFHKWLDTQIATEINKNYPIENPTQDHLTPSPDPSAQDFAEAFTHGLFGHNMLSLYSVFHEIEMNLLHQGTAQMRTVLESFPKMYYLAYYPEYCKNIFLVDVIKGCKNDTERNEKLEKYRKTTPVKDFKIFNPAEIIDLAKTSGHFNWFLDRIYSDNPPYASNTGMKQWYKFANISVHPTTMKHQITYDGINTESIFTGLKCLLFYNIHAEIESHAKIITKLNVYEEISNFMLKISPHITSDNRFPYIFPNHPDIESKIKFKKLIEQFQSAHIT